ncbi:hypothetical protein BDW59DRAFT_164789 [Aspergillus cavernicola]|uniref:Uncharacterized protein n=1 Tax=Aspergillus cavernicola TaxID=176166 RepID=A0ABR4HXF2_9EURO
MPSCTSPNTLCNQCQPLYQRIQRAAAGRIEDVILHEGAYPVLFLNTLVGRNDPNLETELKETLKKRLEDKYRTPVPLHVRVDTVQLQASVCQAGMVIIDFPSLVTVDLNLHKMLFDMTEAGLQGWKSQALQELPGCYMLYMLDHKRNILNIPNIMRVINTPNTLVIVSIMDILVILVIIMHIQNILTLDIPELDIPKLGILHMLDPQ